MKAYKVIHFNSFCLQVDDSMLYEHQRTVWENAFEQKKKNP